MHEWYGLASRDIWGVNALLPMPVERESLSRTSGPRFFSIAIWATKGMFGNNDAIFKSTVLNVKKNHRSQRRELLIRNNNFFYFHASDHCIFYDGIRHHSDEHWSDDYKFRQMGWQTNMRPWKFRHRLYWTQVDTGEQRRKIHVLDVRDKDDIYAPMRNTRQNIEQMAAKYEARNRMSAIYFRDYFVKFYENTEDQVYGADVPMIGIPYNEQQ